MTLEEQFGCRFERSAALLFSAPALVRLDLPRVTPGLPMLQNLTRLIARLGQRHVRVAPEREARKPTMYAGHHEPGFRAGVGDANSEGGESVS